MNLDFKNIWNYKAFSRLFIALIFVIVLISYHLIFSNFFPNSHGKLGHDYRMWFPRLLAGYYWFETNGLFAIPWFTPALCGGILLFANPQDLYFSVPQWLTFWVDPLTGIWLTFIIFAMIGFLGFFLLLRRVFGCSPWSSLLGGTLFLFNGFYTYRIIIGHLGYHSFMLMPIIALLLLHHKDKAGVKHHLYRSLLSALAFSYVFYSGGIHLLIPMTFSIMAIAFIYAIKNNHLSHFMVRLTGCLIIVFFLSFSKLTASLATLNNLPREGYVLPGIPRLLDAFWLPFKALFFISQDWEVTQNIFTNFKWPLDRHEFEIGITLIPLFLILMGIKCLLSIKKKEWLYLLGLFFILMIPILVNFYTPEWNIFLKKLPVLKNSSTLVRWYSIYVPTLILIAILVFERYSLKPVIRVSSSLVFIALVITLNIARDKSYYAKQSYDPTHIIVGYLNAKEKRSIPDIKHVATAVIKSAVRDDSLMILGVSQLNCYESLFGYKHEFFPKKDQLVVGSVIQLRNGHFNMKNPACYTFPDQNDCDPGDHFKTDQREDLVDFIHYRNYEFEISLMQKIANYVTLLTLISCFVYLIGYIICISTRKMRTNKHKV